MTQLDRKLDQLLHALLPLAGEGWLSEESADSAERIDCERVWVVDPLDGTKEFLRGIPEWCISVGLVEKQRAVAGGICNPVTSEFFLGAPGLGVTLNGRRVAPLARRNGSRPVLLASRSEIERGDWTWGECAGFEVRPLGSVAYKLARVAVEMADATWTFVPKHEWDVAAGVALVEAAGGWVRTPEGVPPAFNQRQPRLDGLIALARPDHTLITNLVAARRGGRLRPRAEAAR